MSAVLCDECGRLFSSDDDPDCFVPAAHKRHDDILCKSCREAHDGERKIVTTHVYPPIPIRHFDWQAIFDGDEPPCLSGHGRTEAEAIADLRQQVEDMS